MVIHEPGKLGISWEAADVDSDSDERSDEYDLLAVEAIAQGSPASHSECRVGQVLVAVGQQRVDQMRFESVVALLKDPRRPMVLTLVAKTPSTSTGNPATHMLEPSLRQVQQLPAEEEDRFEDDAPYGAYPDSPPPAGPEEDRFEGGAPSPAPAAGGGGTASLGKIVVCAETLLQAAVDGEAAVLAHCLASGEVWVEAADEFTGNTALMEAAADGHADCAALLLDHHADINAACQVRRPSRESVLRAG